MTSKIDENNAALERDYQQKKRAQQNLAINLSRISPASALTFGSMTLARTGVDEFDRFLASVRTYKPIYTKWINSKIGESINFQTGETEQDQPRRHAPARLRAGVAEPARSSGPSRTSPCSSS
ncbi:MAG: DUF3526 domain-containing protein [Candidatus Moduliflexus flocculans]|nr:DUF3526 domain-containing protein [Candidatus Moduliflexus flocculans]